MLAAGDEACGLLGGRSIRRTRPSRISLAAMRRSASTNCGVVRGQSAQAGQGMAPFEMRWRGPADGAARADPRSDFEAARARVHHRPLRTFRHPRHRFLWLMGADALGQFHRWKAWRNIARRVPIAVIGRPGYNHTARAARAMGWLRRFVRPSSQARKWTEWSAPAILLLRLPPDPTSATAIRALAPNWHRHPRASTPGKRRASSSNRRTLARSSSR